VTSLVCVTVSYRPESKMISFSLGLTYFHRLHAAHTGHLALSVCLQRRAGRFWNFALGMQRLLDSTCVSPGCGVPAFRVWRFGESPGKPWSGICHFANKGKWEMQRPGLPAVLSLQRVTDKKIERAVEI
jgi:hypothetical protein